MKKVLIMVAACAALSVVNADVLYWMVSDTEVEKVGNDSSAFGDSVFATLKATKDGETITLVSKTGAQVWEAYDGYASFAYTMGDPMTTPYSNYSFFIELYNGAQSDTQTYNALKNSGYISTDVMGNPTTLATAGFGQSSTYVVPEPTSGLLFLVGGMLLGLKRRRMA